MGSWAFGPGPARWWAHSGGLAVGSGMCKTQGRDIWGGALHTQPSKICTQLLPGRWQYSVLGKRSYSNSHKGMLQARRERPWAVPGPLGLFGVGLLTNGDLWSHLGPLPLSPLLSIPRLKLSEAVFGGRFLTHTYFILLARVLQKQSCSLKSRTW